MTAVADAGGAPAFAAVCLTPTIRQGLLARGAGFQASLEPLADTRLVTSRRGSLGSDSIFCRSLRTRIRRYWIFSRLLPVQISFSNGSCVTTSPTCEAGICKRRYSFDGADVQRHGAADEIDRQRSGRHTRRNRLILGSSSIARTTLEVWQLSQLLPSFRLGQLYESSVGRQV